MDPMVKDLYLEDGVDEHVINSRIEGGISEVSFGHHSNLYGYTTSMSDIQRYTKSFQKLFRK